MLRLLRDRQRARHPPRRHGSSLVWKSLLIGQHPYLCGIRGQRAAGTSKARRALSHPCRSGLAAQPFTQLARKPTAHSAVGPAVPVSRPQRSSAERKQDLSKLTRTHRFHWAQAPPLSRRDFITSGDRPLHARCAGAKSRGLAASLTVLTCGHTAKCRATVEVSQCSCSDHSLAMTALRKACAPRFPAER